MDTTSVVLVLGPSSTAEPVGEVLTGAGVPCEVVDPAAGRPARWGSAGMVLVTDTAAKTPGASFGPPRRAVVLLGEDLDDAGVWARASRLGADSVRFLDDPEDAAWVASRAALATAGCPGRVAAVAIAESGYPTVRLLHTEQTLPGMQQLVGGLIDCVGLATDLDMWINDEGLYTHPPNPVGTLMAWRQGAHRTVYHGPVVFTATRDDGETGSLDRETARWLIAEARSIRRALRATAAAKNGQRP